MSDEDILNLRTVSIPEHVTRVEGCTCDGGDKWHRSECAIFMMPPQRNEAAVAAARLRAREHTAELNRRLHALLTEAAA